MRPLEAFLADETLKKGFCLARRSGWLQMYSARRVEGGRTVGKMGCIVSQVFTPVVSFFFRLLHGVEPVIVT